MSSPPLPAGTWLLLGGIVSDIAAEAATILAQLQLADPRDPTPAAALESLESADGNPQSPGAMAQLFAQLADAVEDVPLKVYYLTTAASIHEEKLKQPDEASLLYRRAFELNRKDPAALSGVKAHAERQGRWDELLQALYSEARAEKGSAAAAILYQAARLCSEKLGRDGDAVEALVVARQQAPQDPLVLGELARLYEQMGRFPELAEVLSARALGCRNPAEAVEVQLKLGALYEERLGREEDGEPRCVGRERRDGGCRAHAGLAGGWGEAAGVGGAGCEDDEDECEHVTGLPAPPRDDVTMS